jgi:hypothetical protein
MCSTLSGIAAALLLLAAAVAPAGAQVVDHFRVYPNAAGFGLDGPVVQIDDQFGTQLADLGRPTRFMVPVDKNDEGLFDFYSHLTCYQIVDGVAGPAVISTNQFGAQPLTLGVPDSLCVPTEKLISPGPSITTSVTSRPVPRSTRAYFCWISSPRAPQRSWTPGSSARQPRRTESPSPIPSRT